MKKLYQHTLGEEYLDGEVVSVWSDFGRHYRAKDETSFTLAGVEYLVTRRRQINIEDGSLIDVFDEFLNEEASDKGSRFDPFLQKIVGTVVIKVSQNTQQIA